MTFEEFRAYLAELSTDHVDAITAAAYRVLRRKARFRAALRRCRWHRRGDDASTIAVAVNARGGRLERPISTGSHRRQ